MLADAFDRITAKRAARRVNWCGLVLSPFDKIYKQDFRVFKTYL